MSNNYGKKIVDTAKKYATDAIKAASKRAIQKNAEETGDLIGNKVAGKITSISKKSNMRLPTIDEVSNFLLIKKRCISPEERQQIIDELRLIPKNY